MKRFIRVTIFLSLISLSLNSMAASLVSTVNRNQVSTNETLTLTVTIDEQVDTSSLDLSELERDFEVLGTSPQSRSSINIINGRSVQEATTVWTITLVAKREGKLAIPAFNIGTANSQAIAITVTNAKKSANSTLPLDVSVSANREVIYPNQQFIVTVELSAQRDVRDLSGPQLVVADADVEALDQQNFQRVDNGIARQIVVLKYAVFAKKAGKLTIPILTYTGLKNARRGIFGNSGDQVIARSTQIELEVKEAPINASNSKQSWFSADNVSISSQWSTDISSLTVGQPVTRTITIAAKGQHASAIPPLDTLGTLDGLKSYKDQPQLETGKTSEGFIASRTESEAIVANKAGEFTLPAQSIEWWDNTSKSWKTASLAAETLVVTGSALALSDAPSPNAQPVLQTDNNADLGPNNIDHTAKLLPWQILSAALGLIVIFQLYLLRRLRGTRKLKATENLSLATEKSSWSTLQGALKSNQAAIEIRNAIVTWANSLGLSAEPMTLTKLSKIADDSALSESLSALDRQLYQAQSDQGSGQSLDDLSSQLSNFRSKIRQTQDKLNAKNGQHHDSLKPLYPN